MVQYNFKLLLKISLLIIVILNILTSCSKHQPKCNDNDVKESLIDIIKEQLENDIEREYFNEIYNYSKIKDFAVNNGIDIDSLNNVISEKLLLEAWEHSLLKVDEFTFQLSKIRQLNIEESLKKCNCAAEILINAKPFDIKYSAQNTEDNEVYVELFSIDNQSETKGGYASNTDEIFHFEVVDITEHYFDVHDNGFGAARINQVLTYSLDASIVNKSDCKLSEIYFKNTIDLVFSKKTYTFRLDDCTYDKSKLPWKSNDTIHFEFYHYGYNGGFDLPKATLLDYTPNSIVLKVNIYAEDIIGNIFEENFKSYTLMDDWVTFQNTFDPNEK